MMPKGHTDVATKEVIQLDEEDRWILDAYYWRLVRINSTRKDRRLQAATLVRRDESRPWKAQIDGKPNRTSLMLHRFVAGFDKPDSGVGYDVGCLNSDHLDCRRENLIISPDSHTPDSEACAQALGRFLAVTDPELLHKIQIRAARAAAVAFTSKPPEYKARLVAMARAANERRKGVVCPRCKTRPRRALPSCSWLDAYCGPCRKAIRKNYDKRPERRVRARSFFETVRLRRRKPDPPPKPPSK